MFGTFQDTEPLLVCDSYDVIWGGDSYDVIWGVSKQDTKNEKKFRDIMTHVSEKRADRYNTLWADPTANPQVLASSRVLISTGQQCVARQQCD